MKNNMVRNSILHVVKRNAGITLLLLLTVFGAVIVSLIPPQILKLIIDRHLVPKNSSGLSTLAFAYMAAILFIGVFDFMKEVVLTVLGQKISTQIRTKMMLKLERLNAGYFSLNETGAVVSRFTNDVDAISSLFTGGIIGMIVDCFKIIGIVISIWLFNSELGMVTVLLLPLIYGIIRLFQKSMLKAQIKNRVLIGQLNTHIAESLKNIQMIKTFSKEVYMEGRYTANLEENFKTVEKVNFHNSIFPPVIQLIRALVIGFVVVLSSGRMGALSLSLGMIAASIDLVSGLFGPVETLGMELQSIQQAVSGIRRVNEFYGETEDKFKNNALKLDSIIPDRDNICLSFNKVSFHYNKETDVLKEISLQISQQEKVTFVGRTGVGKTTLFKLITGLLQPTEGYISINGTDVCTIPNEEKRRIFGYVDQNFYLVKGTVAEQISLRDSSIAREQIEATLEFVGLKEYVSALDNGMDTDLKNGDVFSQGQKQLLAIARAIVTNPPILLLDEITANLDSLTEEKIVSVLKKAGQSHMILSISHRLSSMIASDTVVILENGRIKNAGTPQMLLLKDEWYRNHMALEKLTWS